MEVEEAKSVASASASASATAVAETRTVKPSDSAQTLPSEPPLVPPPAPPPPAVADPPAVAAPTAVVSSAASQNKKRKLESADLRNSTYFKIRAVVKDLRPFFIEVLQTPDFRNSKGATEIRKRMKVMMDLYKQLTMERISMGKCKSTLDGQSLISETKDKQKPAEKRQVDKRAEQHKVDKTIEKSSGGKQPPGGNAHKSDDGRLPGTYVVGGSPCGWNFLMYPGSKSIYYGVTKESRQVAK